MKILFVSTIYPTPNESGQGVFNRNLVRALSARHEVVVLAPISWSANPPWRSAKGLDANRSRTLDDVTIHHPRYYYLPKSFRTRGWFYWQSVRSTVNRVCRSVAPDLVLSYWAYPDGAIGTRIARQVGAKSAIIVGGSDVLLDTRSTSRRKRVSGTLQEADDILSVSDDLRRKVIELGGNPERSHLWRQGVETNLFCLGDQRAARNRLGIAHTADPVLVWVGRMVPVKGLDILIRACRQLAEQNHRFRLFLVGDGPLRATLVADCRKAGIADRVVFAGPCPQDQLGDWYRAADLMLLPSRSEGLPNVLRESVACGTPFVASRVGGIAEIADERLDRLVPPENPSALAEAIALSLAERNKRPERHYRPVSWSESADHLIELVADRPPASTLQPLAGSCC